MPKLRDFEFNVHYQRSLIHRALRDKKYCTQIYPLLREEIFDSESLKWICKKILEGNKTVRILTNELKRSYSTGEVSEDFRKNVAYDLKSFLKEYDEDETRYAFDRIIEFADYQTLSNVIFQATQEIDEGIHPSKVRETISKAIFASNHTDNETIDLFQDYRNRFSYREERAKSGQVVFVSSGFKSIDRDIRGPMLGQMWTYFGDTNIGKSHAANSTGRQNVIIGKKVHHFVLEDQLDMVLQRYDSSFTKIPYDNLTWSKFSKEQKNKIENIFALLQKRRKNFLKVSKIKEGSTLADIISEFNRTKYKDSFDADVIVLDSPYDMEPIERAGEIRLRHKQVYRELRVFCRDQNVAIISFDQAKQGAKNKKSSDTDIASESYDKARICDGFITMNQTKIQKRDRIIELFTAKMKDRPKHRSYLVRPRYESSYFICIDKI